MINAKGPLAVFCQNQVKAKKSLETDVDNPVIILSKRLNKFQEALSNQAQNVELDKKMDKFLTKISLSLRLLERLQKRLRQIMKQFLLIRFECSFQLLDGEAGREGLLQLLRLFPILDHQRVQITAASHLRG